MKPQTKAEALKVLEGILNKTEESLCNLYFRWQDECQYEDFNDYQKVLQEVFLKHCPVETQFIKAVKQPFGAIVQIPHYPKIHFFVNDEKVGYKKAA